MYRDFSAFCDSVCLTLLRKKMDRESLLISAVVLALNERFSSKCMPSSLKDLELGFSCVLCILSSCVTRDGSCGVPGRLLSKQRTGTTSIFLEGT